MWLRSQISCLGPFRQRVFSSWFQEMSAQSTRRTQPALADSKMGGRVARDTGRLRRLRVTQLTAGKEADDLFLRPREWNPTDEEEPGRGGLLGVLQHPQ